MKQYREVTFFVIEDDDLDFKAVIRAIRTMKMTNSVVRAKQGVEALEILRGENGREKLRRPYIILLDLNLPKMDGIEFLDAIRQDNEFTKDIVFVLSSSVADEDINNSYSRHVSGYIQKNKEGMGLEEAIKMIDHYWRVVELPV